MAQTTQEIYDEIINEKSNYTELNNLEPQIDSYQDLLSQLTTQSKVGIWRLFAFIVAIQASKLSQLFDEFKEWIQNFASTIQVGTLRWYRTKALEYQHGDALIYNNDTKSYEYVELDPSVQIVKLASASEFAQSVLIKVAKLNSGTPEKLTQPELDAFTEYMEKIKFAGVVLDIVSRDPDDLKVYFKIYYDPLVMNANGSLIDDNSVYPVEDAINAYIQNLEFDGSFNITDLTDQLQLAQGVVNPIFQSAEAKSGALVYQLITSYYDSNAGYLEIDPSYPLSSTITYVPAP